MITGFLIATVIVHVTGTKLEATVGQDVTLLFETKVERIDEVRISFEGEDKNKTLIARYFSHDAVSRCERTSEHLQVEEGSVSFTIQNVSRSKQGLYRAQVISGKIESKIHVTLVVNTTSFASSPTPKQPSTPKPANYNLPWIKIAIVGVVFFLCILGVVFFLRHKRKSYSPASEGGSPDAVSPEERIEINDCGGNSEALLV